MKTQQEPTTTELQAQLATVRERLRAVEAIAFRPINITVNFPDWPNPKAWLKRWLADREGRLLRRHQAATKRTWRRLCKRAHRNPRAVTTAELDKAWAAMMGYDNWCPPEPWLVRLREWWAGISERRAVRRFARLAAKANTEDVARFNKLSRDGQRAAIRSTTAWNLGWRRRGYHGSAEYALEIGLKAIEAAGERIRNR